MTDTARTSKLRKDDSDIFPVIFGVIIVLFFCLFNGLGIWQVQRLRWKTDLVARINERIHLAPSPAPPRTEWPDVTAVCCDYLPVRLTGHFLNDREVLVNALTAHGPGYWLLVPFAAADGSLTFINRGFVPMDRKDQATRADGQITGQTTVSGLLRMDEKNGFYPRRNDPAADRWYTRELPAMARARGLAEVAPYFIDADKRSNTGGVPVGGLTVISFPNNHFVYAITWFVLAAGVLLAAVIIIVSNQKKHTYE